MNAKLFATLAATATTVAISGISAPAHAFVFGTDGIQFDKDTKVDFKFLESHGSHTSALNLFEVGPGNVMTKVSSLFWETKSSDDTWKNEWKGTYGNTVASSSGVNKVSYTFKAGIQYVLGLTSKNIDGNAAGTVYSTNAFNNPAGTQQAVFGNTSTMTSLIGGGQAFVGQGSSYTTGNPFAGGGAVISFDDMGANNDKDFQDFTVKAEAVPEPLTMGGIALAGAGLSYARRRQARKA